MTSPHINEINRNIYGNLKFPPEKAREHVQQFIYLFKQHFLELGYKEEKPLSISSDFDSSVVFIGSGISVLKPRLFKGRLPSPGYVIAQDCVRTHNVNKLLDDDYDPMWGSYFTNLLLVSPPGRLQSASNETFDFFEKGLDISSENMLIRINSSDKDLIEICTQRYGKNILEVDTKEPNYYTHKIGVEGVNGRSFNLALRRSGSDEFFDIGNFIIHDYKQKRFFTEIGFGVSTILKELYDLDHVQDCNPVVGLNIDNESLRRKFEDSIITCVVLFREGLRPFTRDNKDRILKQYLRAISYFRAKSDMNIANLTNVISDFEKQEFPESSLQITPVMIESLNTIEKDLIRKKKLSHTERMIVDALKEI